MRLLYSNMWNLSTSVASALSSANAMPAASAQNPDRRAPWRSLTQTADQWNKVDLGSTMTPTCAAIANPRLQNAGTLKLQSSPDNAAWTDVATFPAADPDTNVSIVFFTATGRRYYRVYSTNGNGAVADYAELGYVFLGTYLEPTAKPIEPQISRPDPSVERASEDGQKSYAARSTFAYGAFQFFMAQTDVDNLRTVFRTVGMRTPFFLVLDTTATWLQWLARFSSELSVSLRATVSGGLHTVTISFEEAR